MSLLIVLLVGLVFPNLVSGLAGALLAARAPHRSRRRRVAQACGTAGLMGALVLGWLLLDDAAGWGEPVIVMGGAMALAFGLFAGLSLPAALAASRRDGRMSGLDKTFR